MDDSQLRYGERAKHDADTMREWTAVMGRCADLLPLFADMHLKVQEPRAAKQLGLANTHALRLWLLNRHLPRFVLLRDWYYVVHFVDRFAAGEDSISHWAMLRGDYPSVYYTFILRVTDLRWSDLRSRGPTWVRRRALQVWHSHIVVDQM